MVISSEKLVFVVLSILETSMCNQSKWLDISMTVEHSTSVFSGDTPYKLGWLSGGPIMTSEITMTPHVGTHIDTPFHFGYEGDLTTAPLGLFAGLSLVIEPKTSTHLLNYEDFTWPSKIPPRVLFKMRKPSQGLSGELVLKLFELGVKLIGTSSDSVDCSELSDFPAHHAGLSHGLYFLENLVLDDIGPDFYELFAFPLKLSGAEASPVRACLRVL